MFSKAKTTKSNDAKQANGAQSEPAPQIAASQASPSKRSSQSRAPSVPSLISTDVVLSGNINSAGEIQFDGALEGDLKAALLIIGEKASVKGEVVCETVTVRGRVEGSIRAKSVSLASTAHIVGDIVHSSLSVESGAHFEGNCRHSDDPLAESAAKDSRRSRPTPSTPRPTPSPTASSDEQELRPTGSDGPAFLSQSRSPLR
ncbi:MAG: polymer-forming cytoskeletal protein [Pseudomonadota bacterium]